MEVRARLAVRRRDGSIVFVLTRVRKQTSSVGLKSLPKSDVVKQVSDQGSLQSSTDFSHLGEAFYAWTLGWNS